MNGFWSGVWNKYFKFLALCWSHTCLPVTASFLQQTFDSVTSRAPACLPDTFGVCCRITSHQPGL